jgi:hypothetical protein
MPPSDQAGESFGSSSGRLRRVIRTAAMYAPLNLLSIYLYACSCKREPTGHPLRRQWPFGNPHSAASNSLAIST